MGYVITGAVCLVVGAAVGFLFKTYLINTAKVALDKVSK